MTTFSTFSGAADDTTTVSAGDVSTAVFADDVSTCDATDCDVGSELSVVTISTPEVFSLKKI